MSDRPTAKKFLWFGSKLAQMRFTINKCAEFSSFLLFFWKIRKKSDFKFEIGKKIQGIFLYFFEIFFFSETSHTWISEQINLRNFGTFEIFFAKSEKNPISSLKFWKISNLKSHYFQLFQKKSQIFQNKRKLFIRKCIWANFESDQRNFCHKILQGISL